MLSPLHETSQATGPPEAGLRTAAESTFNPSTCTSSSWGPTGANFLSQSPHGEPDRLVFPPCPRMHGTPVLLGEGSPYTGMFRPLSETSSGSSIQHSPLDLMGPSYPQGWEIPAVWDPEVEALLGPESLGEVIDRVESQVARDIDRWEEARHF